MQKNSLLALNTSARISIHNHNTTPIFLVEAPLKGVSLSNVRVCAESFPRAHAFLCSALIKGREDVQADEQGTAELHRIGLFTPADTLSQPVTYQFPTLGSVPTGIALSRSTIDEINGRTALNLPAEWSEQSLRFQPHHHGSVWAPIRITAGDELDSRCDSGQLKTWQLESHLRESHLDDEATRAKFQREGFAALENLLPATHVHEMGRYFQALAAQGFLSLENAIPGVCRHVAHSHPVARFWHEQLNERVSQLAGRRTKASYVYLSLYLAGGDLSWHTDRPPCEYTISLLLDYAPLDANDRSPWALKVKGRDGTTHLLYQRVGDALIFKGRELSHSRDLLPDGHRSASLLFHFVDEDYDGEME